MITHEQLEKFLSTSPRTKVIGLIGLFIIVFAILLTVYLLGAIKGRELSDSKYLRDREQREKVISEYETRAKVHEENENQAKAENEILKKQNEAAAEILKKSDASLRGDANKLVELNKERTKKIEAINADKDYASQVRGICADYRNAGFGELSFCPKFEGKQ